MNFEKIFQNRLDYTDIGLPTGLWTIVWKSSPPCIDLSSFSLPPGYLSMKIVCVKRPQVCLGRTLDKKQRKERLSRVSFYRLIHRSIELFAPGKSILYSSLSARRLFNRRKIHKRKNSEKKNEKTCNFRLQFYRCHVVYLLYQVDPSIFILNEVSKFLETMRLKSWWWKIWNCEIIDSSVCSIRNSFIALT